LKKKQELNTLHAAVNDNNTKLSHFIDEILFKNLKDQPQLMDEIMSDTKSKWQKIDDLSSFEGADFDALKSAF
jgi:hypothetical protein